MIDFTETHFGNKAPILFIHGLGASSWMWWQQKAAFADVPLIFVDLPGHGKSVDTAWVSLANTADLIAAQVVKSRAVHVVGLSLGGHVALELSKRHPEKILSLFISGITVRPMHFGFLLKLQSHFVQRGIRNERYLEKMAHNHYYLPADKIQDFISNYQLLNAETYEAIWKEIIQFRLDDSYGDSRTPCFIAAGDQESRAIRDSVDIVPQFMPHAIGKLIPGARHDWPLQQAVQFNRILREWIDQQREDNGPKG